MTPDDLANTACMTWATSIAIMADYSIATRPRADPRFIEAEAEKLFFSRTVIVND